MDDSARYGFVGDMVELVTISRLLGSRMAIEVVFFGRNTELEFFEHNGPQRSPWDYNAHA